MSLDLETRPDQDSNGERQSPRAFVDTTSFVRFEEGRKAAVLTTKTRHAGPEGQRLKLDHRRLRDAEDKIALHQGRTIVVADAELKDVQVITVDQLPERSRRNSRPGKLTISKIQNLGQGDSQTVVTTEEEFKGGEGLTLAIPPSGIVKVVWGDMYSVPNLEQSMYGMSPRQDDEFMLVRNAFAAIETAYLAEDDAS